ncbi:ABC transporter transmembrane domain-containing protein, partial [Agromyces seonyuensis]
TTTAASASGARAADAADADARRILRGAVPRWPRLLPSVLFGLASAGSAVALIACSAWLITRAAEQPPVMYLGMAVVGVRAFALGRAVFRYAERLTGHDASFRQLAGIRAGVFERLVPSAPDGLALARRGELLSRFTADVDELQFVPLRAVQPVVSAGVVLVAALVGIALLAPEAALLEAAILAAGILVALAAQRLAGARADRELAPARGALQAAVVEHLDALDALVAFDADAADRARIARLGERLQRAVRRQSAAQGIANAVMAALGGLGALGGILIAAPRLLDGGLSGPAFAVVCLVPLAIAEVAAAIPVAGSAWRAGQVAAGRVARVAPAEPPAGVAVDPV